VKIIKVLHSKDERTSKYLQKTKDNHIIETSYYDLDENILCISSQIGCSMGCIFCATTEPIKDDSRTKSFIRNLTSDEIVQECENVLNSIDRNSLKSKGILFSFMGMGEAFQNYDNVLKSIRILGRSYDNSRFTISTVGNEVELIKKLAHEKIDKLLKLHLSLHAPNDKLRKKILPKARSIKPTLDALKYFSSERDVTSKVIYVLIKGVNDSKKDAIQLANLLVDYPFVVKFSRLNRFRNLEPSEMETLEMFEKILSASGVKFCRFTSDGGDIKAGCGQLRRDFLNQYNQKVRIIF
jgi:23S rRNA (adenine2503-C2)-methyltransferase